MTIATLCVTGGTILDEGNEFAGDVLIANGVIVDDAVAVDSGTLDATGCFVAPGFIDLQLNGAFGIDFTARPERVGEVAALLPSMGVTSFLPTVITSPPEITARAVDVIDGLRDTRPDGAARILGLHLEGPFLNPQRRGAHPPQHLRPPSIEEVRGWTRSTAVAMVTLAPELDGALDVIAELHNHGVVVCAGHTASERRELEQAVSAGLTGATHLYNAMGAMSARAPGTIGATIANEAIITGIIVDGIHVDPIMVALALRVLGPDRLALVTDAIAALGLPHGSYGVGETQVTVDETGAHTRDGVLAGSVLRMDDAVRNLIAFTGCSLATAAKCASTTPAALLGRSDLGRVAVGRAGDLVLLDDEANVVATVIGGVVAHDLQQRFDAGSRD